MENLEKVNLENGRMTTTSSKVAEIFGKNHQHVLRDIRELHCSEDFHKSNFGLLVEMKELPQGGASKAEYYEITKDGFSFLVMGYNGAKAAEFKEQFIIEFNKRSEMLLSDDYILMRSQQIMQNKYKALEATTHQLISSIVDISCKEDHLFRNKLYLKS